MRVAARRRRVHRRPRLAGLRALQRRDRVVAGRDRDDRADDHLPPRRRRRERPAGPAPDHARGRRDARGRGRRCSPRSSITGHARALARDRARRLLRRRRRLLRARPSTRSRPSCSRPTSWRRPTRSTRSSGPSRCGSPGRRSAACSSARSGRAPRSRWTRPPSWSRRSRCWRCAAPPSGRARGRHARPATCATAGASSAATPGCGRTFVSAALAYLLFMGPVEVLLPLLVKNERGRQRHRPRARVRRRRPRLGRAARSCSASAACRGATSRSCTRSGRSRRSRWPATGSRAPCGS